MQQGESVHKALASLQELASLESQTLAAEINVFGQLRDRISPAARFGEKILLRYQRLHFKTPRENELTTCLPEGFPTSDTGKPLTGLIVVDNFSTVQLEQSNAGASPIGQYIGERLYLTRDRKWILAERAGGYSEAPGSTSEWESQCKALSDRILLERYSLETVTEGLFAATNKLWEKLSPRLDTIRQRHDRVSEVTSALSGLNAPREEKPAAAALAPDSPGRLDQRMTRR